MTSSDVTCMMARRCLPPLTPRGYSLRGPKGPWPTLGQGGCQSTEDGYRLGEELGTVTHTREVAGALSRYSRVRVIRTAIVQGFAQLGSDLLVDFDLMMTIPLLGPFFLTATQLSMPWILRFLYTPEF